MCDMSPRTSTRTTMLATKIATKIVRMTREIKAIALMRAATNIAFDEVIDDVFDDVIDASVSLPARVMTAMTAMRARGAVATRAKSCIVRERPRVDLVASSARFSLARRGALHALASTAHNLLARNQTDEELLVAHRSGDASALRIIIERYQGELHGFLTRLVGTRVGADDVFQDTFLQVHLSADSFDQERRFKPWLYTIAANKGRDFLRRQKRRATASLDAPMGKNNDGSLAETIAGQSNAPSARLETSDESALVKSVIDGLPAHFREILLLSYFQKLTYAQMADGLSIPLGTVKSRLHAAVAAFAESWKIACARRGITASIGIRMDATTDHASNSDHKTKSSRATDSGRGHA